MNKFTHLDENGKANMVDISEKVPTARYAKAAGKIHVNHEVFNAITQGTVKKGDVLATARIAGIMAAKKTPDLIPLCHPLMLSKVNVDFSFDETKHDLICTCEVRLTGKTGAEMEALTGVTVALLTVYDMCKALDKQMEIGEVRLVEKSGGKSGHYVASEERTKEKTEEKTNSEENENIEENGVYDTMKKATKKILTAGLALAGALAVAACNGKKDEDKTKETKAEKKEVIVLAAASLKDVCGELETMYEAKNENIDLVFSYAGSGALQAQIEEGAPADLFISAGKKQIKALQDGKLMKDDTVCDLLENKVVLIVPNDSTLGLTSFEDVKKDEVKMVGVGEIESVPAGQYAQTIFTNLGFWDTVEKKANFGTDVRTVLSWVEAGEVDCGVVYATDAYTSDKVKIVAEAPEGSCDKVIYPAGVVTTGSYADDAAAFLNYLKTDEAVKVFEKYGFLKGE